MTDLAGQVALVTGASGGIGGAVARALGAAGADLLLAGRDPERLETVAERAREGAPRVDVACADLGDETAVRALADRAEATFGGVDILIHGAGRFHMGPIEDTPAAELDRQLQINVRAPYLLTQLLLPSLRARQGQIVFINSSVGARAQVGLYAASKHALRALADSLRQEVNRAGVRVLSVFPGRTASTMQQEIHRLEGRPYQPARLLQPEDLAATVLHALVLPRTAEVTDLHLRPMRP